MATLTLTITVPGQASAYQAVANDFLQVLKQRGILRDIALAAGEQTPNHGLNGEHPAITASATFA